MKENPKMFDLETQIRDWKHHLQEHSSIGYGDLEELESHLRDSIDELVATQLNNEEAFLIAVKRLGDVDSIQREFAKASTEDMWRQLFIPTDNRLATHMNTRELLVVIVLTLFAGLLGKVPSLFGYGDFEAHGAIYARNAAIFAFLPIALYFVWKRSLPVMKSIVALIPFLIASLVVNLYPSFEPHHTAMLSAIHLPIVLLYTLLYFYSGPATGKESGWRSPHNRLNFIRFAGESFIFAVLIGLGGVVLILLTMGTFELVGIDASPFIQNWMAPMGFFGLFTIAAYLVEQKKSLIESIAPVLSRIFTPLFFLVLMGLLIAFASNPQDAYENRMLLIWFDVVLALVLALTLYSMSAKDQVSASTRTIWDAFTFALLIAAILVDLIALAGIVIRVSNYGFTANKSAALGENIILLVNLVLLASGYMKFFRRTSSFQSIVRMQTRFLDVYAVWATVVVMLFPLVFSFT